MGSFSFFFSHHLQTMEGGMIAFQSKEDADYVRSLRAHGWCRDLPDNNNIYTKTGKTLLKIVLRLLQDLVTCTTIRNEWCNECTIKEVVLK